MKDNKHQNIKTNNGTAVYVGSSVKVYNPYCFLLANCDGIKLIKCMFLLVNKIKMLRMLWNFVHLQVHKNI